jgi:poly(A) polymerase
MQDLRLDAEALNEPHALNEPKRVAHLPAGAPYPAALAAWLLDRHGEVDADTARSIAGRWRSALMLSNQQYSDLIRILDLHHHLRTDWLEQTVARQKRLAATDGFNEAMALIHAVDQSAHDTIRQRLAELAETGLNPEPLVTGDDLIAAGLTPGPRFKEILDRVYDAQLEGRVHSQEQAMALAHTLSGRSAS